MIPVLPDVNELPDLKSFEGYTREDLKSKLRDEGYEILRRGHLCSVYCKPGSDVVLRISMRPKTAALACEHFQKHAGNPYLPRVFDHMTLDERTHITVMEKLVSIEELAENGREYVFGAARSIASFPFGDRTHEEMHAELAKDVSFMAAVRTLVTCAIQSFHDFSDQDECFFLDRDIDGIMYRQESDGGLQPVLVDTLTYTTPSNEVASEFDNILSRLRQFEYAEYYKRTPAAMCKGPPMP